MPTVVRGHGPIQHRNLKTEGLVAGRPRRSEADHTANVTTNLRRSGPIAVVLLSCVGSFGGCGEDMAAYVSPDRRREAVIETGLASIDTVWTVSVRDTKTFSNREDVGCFTDDAPESAPPTGATWSSADEFAISTTADDESVRVALNADGRWAVATAPDDFLAPCPYS